MAALGTATFPGSAGTYTHYNKNPKGLVGARIEVYGKGTGTVIGFTKALTGQSPHTILWSDGVVEEVLLDRATLLGLRPNGGAGYRILEEFKESPPDLVKGPCPTFKNSPGKPSAAAVASWKWQSKWTLELSDVEVAALPKKHRATTRGLRQLLGGRRQVAYPMPVVRQPAARGE